MIDKDLKGDSQYAENERLRQQLESAEAQNGKLRKALEEITSVLTLSSDMRGALILARVALSASPEPSKDAELAQLRERLAEAERVKTLYASQMLLESVGISHSSGEWRAPFYLSDGTTDMIAIPEWIERRKQWALRLAEADQQLAEARKDVDKVAAFDRLIESASPQLRWAVELSLHQIKAERIILDAARSNEAPEGILP